MKSNETSEILEKKEMQDCRDRLHLLMDKIMDVKEQTSFYASFEISGYSSIELRVVEGPLDDISDYSLYEDIPYKKLAGSKRAQRAIDYLDSLLPARKGEKEK